MQMLIYMKLDKMNLSLYCYKLDNVKFDVVLNAFDDCDE